MARAGIRGGEGGQAAVEYVGLVALAAAALATLAVLVPRPAHHMLAVVERAICTAFGSRCELGGEESLALEPCPLMHSESQADVGVTVLSVRTGGGRSATVEVLSDGSAVVTIEDRRELGTEAGVGARLATGGEAGGARAAAGAGVGFAAGSGYEFATVDGAARFLVELRRTEGSLAGVVSRSAGACPLCDSLGIGEDERPAPDFTFLEGAQRMRAEAEAGVTPVTGGARAALDGVLGRRVHHGTGEVTTYHRLSAEASADLGAPFGGAGAVQAETILEHTTTGDGRPLTLVLRSTRSAAGGAGGSLRVPASGGAPGVRDAGTTGDLVERVATLDLDETRDRRAAVGVLDALGPPAAPLDLPARMRVLARRLEADGEHDVRVYSSSAHETEVAGEGSLGLKLGADLVRRAAGRTLTSAHTSPAGATLFLERTDCAG